MGACPATVSSLAVLLMFSVSGISDRLFAHDDLFVTGFHIPANWEAPEKFNLKAYAGMSLCQRVRNKAGENWLLIWWTDPRYYDLWSDQLASKLNLPAKPKFAEQLQSASRQRSRFGRSQRNRCMGFGSDSHDCYALGELYPTRELCSLALCNTTHRDRGEQTAYSVDSRRNGCARM